MAVSIMVARPGERRSGHQSPGMRCDAPASTGATRGRSRKVLQRFRFADPGERVAEDGFDQFQLRGAVLRSVSTQ